MRYHAETYLDGAILRVYRDEHDHGIWRIQVTGRVQNELVDIKVYNGLELELGTITKE